MIGVRFNSDMCAKDMTNDSVSIDEYIRIARNCCDVILKCKIKIPHRYREDAIQEAMMLLVKYQNNIDRNSNYHGYIYRLCYNSILRFYQRHVRKWAHTVDFDESIVDNSKILQHSVNSNDDTVDDIIRFLPGDYSKILKHILDGGTISEYANMVGQTYENVRYKVRKMADIIKEHIH